MITKKLAKAKADDLVVSLRFKDNTYLKCKIFKLLGTEIEVMTNKIERRKILINSLVSVNFVDEYVSELH